MAEDAQRSRLGRGLAALIGDVTADTAPARPDAAGPRRAPVEMLRPNPRNPRRSFDDTELDELASSIRSKGLIQPIVVRRVPGQVSQFEIIAGERRWRAAQRAGLTDVPIVVVEADDRTSLEFAIIENVQRADLNPIEEAIGYQNLIGEFTYTQADLAESVGKSRSHITNTLRLLKLPEDVQALLSDGSLSAGHGRALLAVADPSSVAKRVVSNGLSVREAEEIAQREARKERPAPARPPEADEPDGRADIAALEKALESYLGLPVAIRHGAQGGELRIRYRTVEQLDGICKSLTG
ncbi:chromosome segregation DNA-binding protein [Rhizobiales bacterium GAS191]|nr:chromosome segregation DNA-binding protein [Rhizobiales bacterium GAS113]SEC13650.1 chromosome segregation DNA-binding protein [Rhizobiales bacterium GAS191]SED07094.1 chromosome segregation DNA-binding protein [Rhizobiales bacterium GAS188]